MHGRGVRGWGKHLSRVKRWKEVLWEAQTLERSAQEKRQEENSSGRDRVLTRLWEEARGTGGGEGEGVIGARGVCNRVEWGGVCRAGQQEQ